MNFWMFMYKVLGIRKPCPKELQVFDEIIEKVNDCKLSTCLKDYGGGDNKFDCLLKGHTFCYCDYCAKHPTCLRCRLYIQTGHYL